MSGWTDDCVALPDANVLIQLMRSKPAMKTLERLGTENRLRIIDDVRRECIKRPDTKTSDWVKSHPQFTLTPVDEVMTHMTRLAKSYGLLFSTEGKAADPMLVATACYYRESEPRRIVITDDHGVQAVCWIERLEFLTPGAFRKLLDI